MSSTLPPSHRGETVPDTPPPGVGLCQRADSWTVVSGMDVSGTVVIGTVVSGSVVSGTVVSGRHGWF